MPEINDARPEQPEPQQPVSLAPASLVPACPRCGLADRVAGVPAVYLAGRSRTTEAAPTHDDPSRTVTRQTTTALSAALAPAPAARFAPLGFVGALAALVAIGTFILIGGAIAGQWPSWSGDPQGAVAQPVQETTPTGFWTTGPDGNPMYVTGNLGPLKQFVSPPAETHTVQHAATSAGSLAPLGWISTIALLLAVVLLVGVVRRRLLLRKVTAGYPAAERIWAQAWYCDRCATVHLPPTTPGAPARPFTLAEFRMRVWTAGGYGHLARKQPLP